MLEFSVQMETRRIIVNGTSIEFPNKEMNLLIYFLQNSGKVLTRTQILEDVWDRNICCSTNTVDVHVSKLRQRMRPHISKQVIRTIYCAGYIFEP
ncbi:MAG: winged helix-turn-helix domain-containing protein [bacterium]|nr:winged helix-turn-helix domain-containing protein [bacterium]